MSCSSDAVETGKVNLIGYDGVDLLLGLERNDGHSVQSYKTFSTLMQNALQRYTTHGGALLVSGAYIGTDMTQESDRRFLQTILKSSWGGRSQATDNKIKGLGTEMAYWKTLNEEHYAATSPDVLHPVGSAFCALLYGDGRSASVAYDGRDYKSFVMGFPFECITSYSKRQAVMRGILSFLMKD